MQGGDLQDSYRSKICLLAATLNLLYKLLATPLFFSLQSFYICSISKFSWNPFSYRFSSQESNANPSILVFKRKSSHRKQRYITTWYKLYTITNGSSSVLCAIYEREHWRVFISYWNRNWCTASMPRTLCTVGSQCTRQQLPCSSSESRRSRKWRTCVVLEMWFRW